MREGVVNLLTLRAILIEQYNITNGQQIHYDEQQYAVSCMYLVLSLFTTQQMQSN